MVMAPILGYWAIRGVSRGVFAKHLEYIVHCNPFVMNSQHCVMSYEYSFFIGYHDMTGLLGRLSDLSPSNYCSSLG